MFPPDSEDPYECPPPGASFAQRLLHVALVAVLAAWGVVCAPCPRLIAQQPAPAGPSVDDALLEDLDNDLLEGVGDLKKKPPKPADEPSGSEPPADVPDQSLIDGEDVGMPSADDDPLGYISQQMRLVEQLIPERAKHAHAEAVQQRIVDDLSRLIRAGRAAAQPAAKVVRAEQRAAANRQAATGQQPKSPGQSSSGKDSNKPASDSSNRLGKADAARPDPELFRGLMKDAWGTCPSAEREQMLQISPERFLPQYELLIERYYRRLAEERSQP